MNNFTSSHMRSRRNLLDLNGFTPIQFPRCNYSTDAQTKSDMKCTFGDDLFLNNFHLLSDPLKKNLADSVITGETKNKNMIETKDYATKEAVKPPITQRTDYYPTLAGITNFFAGVFNVMGTIFQKRASSPVSQYYDCFDKEYDERQMAPPVFWQPANFEVQNKNEQSDTQFGSNNDSHANLDVEMNVDCRTAANQCKEKLNQLHLLISQKNNQNVQKTNNSKLSKRPRKAFIDAGSVEDNFEDAFSPESFVSLANDTFIEYCSPFNFHDELLIESDAPRIKTEFYFDESMDITQQLPEQKECKETMLNQNLSIEKQSNDDVKVTKTKDEIISSCEDKLSKLKALLQSKHCKSSPKEPPTPTDPVPIPNQNLETVFGNEINSLELQNSNSQNSDYFNEVTGRFNSSSVDSEDSFQIVFTDSPQNFRRRIPSDCESEDSFIVFEESPDSCYTSNEVFGDDILDNDSSDSDSDIEEDSGCNVTCKLSPNLSRTFGDLTDNSLYCQDVVDSGVKVCVPSIETEKTGLLVDETRKIEKKKLPTKKVHFSTDPPKVHVMRVWAFAARQARAGHWERHALDRERFKRRIADVEMAISWVLKPQHRSRVVFQRFRPWWNAQKRKELAEKKETEEREKLLRMTEEDARSNDCVESSDNCDTYVDDNVDLEKDKRMNSFEKDRNDLSQDTIVGVVGDINNDAIKETFDTIQERKVSQNSNDSYLSALNTQVNNNCDMKISEISDSLKTTTINGSLETTKINGLLETTKVNDSLVTTKANNSLEPTKINGSLETTKINNSLETTNNDGSLIKSKTLLRDGCIDT